MQNVYSHLKPFYFHEKLDSLKNRTITPPLHIRLKPINACNHRCFYCCYRHDSLFLGENMNEKDMIPEPKINEIATDMIKCGVKAVTFTGGTPTRYSPPARMFDQRPSTPAGSFNSPVFLPVAGSSTGA